MKRKKRVVSPARKAFLASPAGMRWTAMKIGKDKRRETRRKKPGDQYSQPAVEQRKRLAMSAALLLVKCCSEATGKPRSAEDAEQVVAKMEGLMVEWQARQRGEESRKVCELAGTLLSKVKVRRCRLTV